MSPRAKLAQNGDHPKPAPEADKIADALRLIEGLGHPLYVTVAGIPSIELIATAGTRVSADWPLQSLRVKAWIGDMVWKQQKSVLTGRAIDHIINVLVGKAWNDVREVIQAGEVERALDDDPLFEAVYLLMHERETVEKSCTALLADLGTTAAQHALDITHRLWPKGAAQLSRRLSQLRAPLRTVKVTVKIDRRPKGARYVKLERLRTGDDGVTAPPSPPSVDNAHHPKSFRRCDGGDADSQSIFESLKPNGGTSP